MDVFTLQPCRLNQPIVHGSLWGRHTYYTVSLTSPLPALKKRYTMDRLFLSLLSVDFYYNTAYSAFTVLVRLGNVSHNYCSFLFGSYCIISDGLTAHAYVRTYGRAHVHVLSTVILYIKMSHFCGNAFSHSLRLPSCSWSLWNASYRSFFSPFLHFFLFLSFLAFLLYSDFFFLTNLFLRILIILS